jgi:ribosome maturation factor RimP
VVICDSWRIVDSWFSWNARGAFRWDAGLTTQDEELAVTTGLPSQTQVTELLGGEFARAGYEIEEVVIDSRARPPRITVIADGDAALDLNTVAALSRSASALLDGLDNLRDRYVLEVSSPGVDRPLTSEKHFRRARGRKVELQLSDGSQLTGRVGETRDDTVALVVRRGRGSDQKWELRQIRVAEIVKAIVQVEFSPPTQAESELATGAITGKSSGTEAGA